MRKESGFDIEAIRVDGGLTANRYLMQFQCDMADAVVQIPELQELSGMGAAYMAGIAAGIYNPEKVYEHISYTAFVPKADAVQRELHYRGWKAAVKQVLVH